MTRTNRVSKLRPIACAIALCLAFVAEASRAQPAQPTWVEPAGGGALPTLPADSLGPDERLRISVRLALAREALGPRVSAAGGDPTPASFTWPLRAKDGFQDPGYHGTSYFVDLDPAFPDRVLDWNCGRRTYDLASGYNHAGTDFFLWPFGWTRMFDESIEVVAAAPGTVLFAEDGNFDGSCSMNDEMWNAVYVLHDDQSVAWYGHLKTGSATHKGVGERVERGERLGLVGSSGSSTSPHLHLEVHDADGAIVDPFAGLCRPGASLWESQPAYYDSALNQVSTHDGVPGIDACNEREDARVRDSFLPGETVYFATFYRDQLLGQVSSHTVRTPDGEVFSSWVHAPTETHYASSYWYWYLTLPDDAATGTWRYEVTYLEQRVSHPFQVPEPQAGASAAIALVALGVARGLDYAKRPG